MTHSISSPVRLGGDMALTCRANKVNRKFIKLALKFCCRMLICVFSGRLLSMPDICHFDRTQLALGPVCESVTHYEWLSAMRSPKVSARWCSSCMEWTVGCQWDGGGQGAQGLGGHHQGVKELEFVFVFGADSMALFNCATGNVFTHVHTVLTKLPPRSINHHFCNMQYMWKGGTPTGARRLQCKLYTMYTV